MRILELVALALFIALPTTVQAQSALRDPWQIIPCSSFGPIQANTSQDDLIKLFGKDNLQETQLEGPEGESYPATIVFPNDPAKKVEIVWKDAVGKRNPGEVTVRGTKGAWKTSQGITLGTGLKDLETMNGAPFTISGFGWDYGGHVLSWGQGKLSALPKRLILQFDPKANPKATDKDVLAVSGDKDFKSNLPALQRLNPGVSEISCTFP